MKRYAAISALGGVALAAKGAAEQAVEELIPKLADAEVGKRYEAQMALQDIASEASKPGNEDARKELGQGLAAKASDPSVPQPARVWIVRQLEYMGGAEAVKALTKVMNGDDAELRESARRALEKNPAREATNALRSALERATDTTCRIGLMNSLGERGDARSVKLIAKGLGDAKTAPAAALALGKIASRAAVKALWGAFGQAPEVGAALINAANQLQAKDKSAARAIYQRMAKQAQSEPLRTAAEFGLAKTS